MSRNLNKIIIDWSEKMIVKQREIPLVILKLEALLRRLPSHQLFRNKDGEESVFPCPIVQVNRQENQLKDNGLGQLPIF